MLTRADVKRFPSASFAIYRSPAKFFAGISDGIDSEPLTPADLERRFLSESVVPEALLPREARVAH
jgi:hypothetical protein